MNINIENTPYILVGYDIKYKELYKYIKCVCTATLDIQDLQIDDYITHPMIWCEECSGRYFLDICTTEDVTEFMDCLMLDSSMKKKIGIVKDYFAGKCNESEYEYPVYKIPICYIKEVAGSNMCNFHAECKLNKNEIDELGNAGVFKLFSYDVKDIDNIDSMNIICKLMKKYKVTLYIENYMNNSIEFVKSYDIPLKNISNHDNYCICENIMIECNSYNVENPVTPYPNYLYTNHDGVTVTCRIISQGIEKIVSYWGD